MTAMMMTMPYLGWFCRSPATRLLRSTKVNGGGGDKSDGLMRSEVHEKHTKTPTDNGDLNEVQ
jgi:hypothetical protein